MSRRVIRVLAWATALAAALAAGGVYLRFRDAEPMNDMRQRADALPIPDDFVLVSESYNAYSGGLFGSRPELERTYHAAWPGSCDSLRGIRDRVAEPLQGYQRPPALAGRVCDYSGVCRAGWDGWLRGWSYRLDLTSVEPGLVQEEGPYEPAFFLVLHPRGPLVPRRRVAIPPGRAKITIHLMGSR